MTGSALRGTSALDVHFGPEAICLLKEGVWGRKRARLGSIEGRRIHVGGLFLIFLAPRRLKMTQDAPRCPQDAPKMPPRRLQEAPRCPHDAPGLGKWSPNGVKLAFKSLQIEGWFRKSHNRSNRTLAAAGAGFSRVLGSIFGC